MSDEAYFYRKHKRKPGKRERRRLRVMKESGVVIVDAGERASEIIGEGRVEDFDLIRRAIREQWGTSPKLLRALGRIVGEKLLEGKDPVRILAAMSTLTEMSRDTLRRIVKDGR